MTPPTRFAAARIPALAARLDTGPPDTAGPVSEHARLTAGTADLWRELATVAAGGTP